MESSPTLDENSCWYNNQSSENLGNMLILDSTLREGEQSPGVSFTVSQRLQIAWMLDYFGVDAIEISPIVSPSHEEACKAMIKAGLNANIVAHVRALRADIDVALRCDAKWIAMYHSVSDIHLKWKLKVTREEAIRRSLDAIDYARAHGLRLRFTAEDASRTDPEFLKKFCIGVSEAGADRISLPDTVGALRPEGMKKMVRMIHDTVDTPLDVHCHNDLGLAVANALAGCEAGATQIHTTINGLGERVGITPLAEAALALNLQYNKKQNLRLETLRELSEMVERYTGLPTPPSKPIVGSNAYRHKAGTHVAAIIRNTSAYEIIAPERVGNSRKIVFGELSGRNGAAFLLKVLGLEPSAELAATVAKGLKSLNRGDLFELSLDKHLEEEAVRAEEVVSQQF